MTPDDPIDIKRVSFGGELHPGLLVLLWGGVCLRTLRELRALVEAEGE